MSTHLLKPDVYQIYEQIRANTIIDQNDHAQFAVLQASNVLPDALIRCIQNHIDITKDESFVVSLKNLQEVVKGLQEDGKGGLFIRDNYREGGEYQLEFLCAAVRTYMHRNGKLVCDYCLATTTFLNPEFHKTIHESRTDIDSAGLGIGLGLVGQAVIYGGLAIIATGPGVVFLAVGAGVIGAGGILASSLSITKTTETKLVKIDGKNIEQIRSMLEACFIAELVSRGHASVDQSRKMQLLPG